MKEKNTKINKGIATLTLCIALIVTGSLAWQDISQHKTNNFATKTLAQTVVLVEDFEPIENWTLNSEVKKEVFVRNGQESDNLNRFHYSDGYVRLQFREFMGIAKQNYVTYEKRLMIQKDGNFYRFEKESDAKEMANALSIDSNRVVPIQGFNDDKIFYYIETAAGDVNGQYGKFLIKDITNEKIHSLLSGKEITNLDYDVVNKHNSKDGKNQEDGPVYTTHLWSENQENFTPIDNVFSEYLKWKLGDDVISLQQWKDNYQSKAVPKWIVDTSDKENGYVYWGQSLEHSSNEEPNSITSKLLETVKLIKQPDGHAEYRIHVNMDAVSYDDLDKWDDVPEEIKAAYDKQVEENFDYKLLLQELVTKTSNYENFYFKNYIVVVDFKNALDNSINLLSSSTSNQEEYKEHYEKLTSAYDDVIKMSQAKLGDKIYVADREFTYVKKNDKTGEAIILSNSLSYDDYKAMGKVNLVTPEGLTKFKKDAESGDRYTGYINSNVHEIDRAFYKTFISTHLDNNHVLSVQFEDQIANENNSNWIKDDAHPTIVSKNGEKVAFSLAVSDINQNEYGNAINSNHLTSDKYTWLRSPGYRYYSSGILNLSGNFEYAGQQTPVSVRPALWVKLPN